MRSCSFVSWKKSSLVLRLPDLISLLIFNFAAQSTQCREKVEPESPSSLTGDPASGDFSLRAKDWTISVFSEDPQGFYTRKFGDVQKIGVWSNWDRPIFRTDFAERFGDKQADQLLEHLLLDSDFKHALGLALKKKQLAKALDSVAQCISKRTAL